MAAVSHRVPIATLSFLAPDHPAESPLAEELRLFSRQRPLALVLPCHVNELGSQALQTIIESLRHADYLSEIIIGLDGARRSQLDEARRLFKGFPCKTSVLWTSSPAVRKTLAYLNQQNLPVGAPGKGRNLWLCIGALLANREIAIIATHDCDIRTYHRHLLERLCYPLVHPDFQFVFSKGYSSRYSDRLHGRVMRLLFSPFLCALRVILGDLPLLVFIDSFRYALAGETALTTNLAWQLRIPSDWSVEVGMLAGIFRICHLSTIVQTEVARRFDHKHRDLSPNNPKLGLHRMATDIALSLLQNLLIEGVPLSPSLLDCIHAEYHYQTKHSLKISAAQAAINGLKYDRYLEELAVNTFLQSTTEAIATISSQSIGSITLPSHTEASLACPGLQTILQASASPCF